MDDIWVARETGFIVGTYLTMEEADVDLKKRYGCGKVIDFGKDTYRYSSFPSDRTTPIYLRKEPRCRPPKHCGWSGRTFSSCPCKWYDI